MLKDFGIPLTDDIKKAMPSAKRSGDANSLQYVLKEKMEKHYELNLSLKIAHDNTERIEASKVNLKINHNNLDEVKAGFKREVEATNFDADKTGTFLRSNSPTATALAMRFTQVFTSISTSCAKAAEDAIFKSLSSNKDPDIAMTAGYKALLGSLSTITLPDSFNTMCLDMAKEINQCAEAAIKKDPGKAGEIKTVADTFKNTIVSLMLLRVFTNQVTISLRDAEKDMKTTAPQAVSEFKATTSMQKLTAPLLALLNGATDPAKFSGQIYTDHPEFRKFVVDNNQNNLNDFKAYQQLNAQIMAMNSSISN